MGNGLVQAVDHFDRDFIIEVFAAIILFGCRDHNGTEDFLRARAAVQLYMAGRKRLRGEGQELIRNIL